MSLRLLLDEDSQAKYLVNLLQIAGHDVLTVNEADLMTQSDSRASCGFGSAHTLSTIGLSTNTNTAALITNRDLD